ncbi:MAG: hypothetical protein ACMUEL_01630 [Flavobacteriales bacterium Tduv]
MQTKVIKCDPTCFTFIIEASKDRIQKKAYKTQPLRGGYYSIN